MTGKFFALEGLECSGKTTLFNALKNELKDKNVVFIEEAAWRFSKLSPEIYKDKESMEIAYMLDNAITIHGVDRLIKKNMNAIMDRSWICQLVYAKTRKQLNSRYNFNISYIEKHEKILGFLYPEALKDTVVIYLDLSIASILRRGEESNKNHHRKEEFNEEWLKTARAYYKKNLEKLIKIGIKVEYINAEKSIKQIRFDFENIYSKYTTNQ